MTTFDWVLLAGAGFIIYWFDKSLRSIIASVTLLERRVEGMAFRLEGREYLAPGLHRSAILDELYPAEPDHLRRLDAWWRTWAKTIGYGGTDELTPFVWDNLEAWTRSQHLPLSDADTTICVTAEDVKAAFRPLVSQTTPAKTALRGEKERDILRQAEEKVENYLTQIETGGAFPATHSRAVAMMPHLQNDLLSRYALLRIHGATLMTRFEILMYFTLFDLLEQRTRSHVSRQGATA